MRASSSAIFSRAHCPPERVLHAYIPDVPGKERRKRAPAREGKLGVEGMPPEVLLEALRRAGAQAEDSPEPPDPITKTESYLAGLSGPGGQRGAPPRAAAGAWPAGASRAARGCCRR